MQRKVQNQLITSGWSSGVFDLQGEILLAPALQKSSHQVIEALRVVHTHAMSPEKRS